MRTSSMKSKKQIIISILLWIFIWETLARIINNDIYLPRVMEVFKSIISLIIDGDFIINIASTTISAIISFILAIIISVNIGVCASVNKYVYNFIYPLIALLKSIPTIIFILIALIWFDKSYVSFLVGFVIIFPLLYEGVIASITSIDKKIMKMAIVYRLSLYRILKNIYMPAIIRDILQRSKANMSLVLKLVIASEVYSQPKFGIGALVQSAKINFNMDEIFAWIIIIIVICALIDVCLKGINLYLKRRRFSCLNLKE